MTGILANQVMHYLASGNTPKRLGNAHHNIAPYQTFAAIDGDIIVDCGNDRQSSALCSVLGLDHLGTDPKFATNPERVSNRAFFHILAWDRNSRMDEARHLTIVGNRCGSSWPDQHCRESFE